jgi:[protein-PII] uridylyltransferase
MAANELRVQIPKQGVDWARVTEDVVRALHGQLALEARLAERARTYRRRRRQAAAVEKNMVRFDNDASSNATVLEVRVPNRVGVLYGITKALAELGLDLRHAKVQSMGDTVFDCFYVRGAQGKITDPFHQREIERAVLHAVG